MLRSMPARVLLDLVASHALFVLISSSMPGKTILVLGSGPGIGLHVPIEFGRHGFTNIILVSRNNDRLQEDKDKVAEGIGNDQVSVKTIALDITDIERLKITLAEILASTAVDCVFFNAARVGPSAFFDFPATDLEKDFNTTVTALYITASVMVPKLSEQASQSSHKPAFLVTNSMLYREPVPSIFSLCVVKAAQRTLVECLAGTYKSRGIHFGLVSVEGEVSPDRPHMSPALIASRTWELYNQDESSWTLEVEINEIKE